MSHPFDDPENGLFDALKPVPVYRDGRKVSTDPRQAGRAMGCIILLASAALVYFATALIVRAIIGAVQ